MQIWQAIVLGAVQGFAEFLPVSSSGHLILFQKWFGINNALFYSVMLHIGTLIPVIVVLRKEIKELFKLNKKLLYLIIASIPAGIVGLACSGFFDLDEIFYEKTYLLGITFFITAIELLIAEKISKRKVFADSVSCKSALISGIGQAIAVIPGLSRSGTTLAFGTLAKLKKEENANFTFLMSIPIILSAVFLEGIKCIKTDSVVNVSIMPLIFGIITSFITGYIAISFMMSMVKKGSYKIFSVYLFIMSAITFITEI